VILKRRNLSLVILTAFLIIAIIPRPATAQATTLVSSWSMDDGKGATVTDQIGGHNGLLSGASWTPSVTVINSSGFMLDLGKGSASPSALDFNDKDNYVEVSDSPALNAKNFSIAFWIAPDSSADWIPIIGKQSKSQNQQAGWVVTWDNSSPRQICLIAYSASNTSLETGIPVPLGEWTHVAFTYQPEEIAAYQNGELARNTSSPGFQPSSEPLRIGRTQSSSGCFDGLIDNIQYYNTSLTETEVRNLYRSYASVANGPTTIQMSQITTNQGQEITVSARLIDQNGSAVSGANIAFYTNNDNVGTAITDSRGYARILFKPQNAGTYSLIGEFRGIAGYDGSAQSVRVTVNNNALSQTVIMEATGAAGAAALVIGLILVKRRTNSRADWGEDMKSLGY
jgi:hypothetical protein